MTIDLRLGDCLEVLKTIPDNSIDSVVTDPPYHLTSIVKRFGKEDSAPAQFGTDGAYSRASKGFMGKEWDGGDIAFRTDVWEECLRILKPGGHLLAFSHSRTYHRMGVAIEDAGFEIRDQIMWVYGSGFPKSHNIGKAIDKIEGNEREVVGYVPQFPDGTRGATYRGQANNTNDVNFFVSKDTSTNGLKPVYAKNNDYEGWGTALKPAHEPIVMARKPLSEKSIAENVLKHGTGGINIDGSRIATDDKLQVLHNDGNKNIFDNSRKEPVSTGKQIEFVDSGLGRFPANIIFDEEAGQLLDEQSGISKSVGGTKPVGGNYKLAENKTQQPYFNFGDKGGASRFFYCPKAAKKDRNEGLDEFEETDKPGKDISLVYQNSRICIDCDKTYNGSNDHSNCSGELKQKEWNNTIKNNHPTVKPTDLMRYLINLITPPNGTILDPFMGSGSTGKAAIRCGVNFIGIEKEQEYMDIAKARIEHEQNKPVQGKLF